MINASDQIIFSESDIVAIVQVCCCLPDDSDLHLSHSVVYLAHQLRMLRRIRFDAPRLFKLQRLMATLEDQVCEALAFELIEIGALTDQGLDVNVIEKNFMLNL